MMRKITSLETDLLTPHCFLMLHTCYNASLALTIGTLSAEVNLNMHLLSRHLGIKLGQFNCEPAGCMILLFAWEFAYWALHENGWPFQFDPQGDRLHADSACWWRSHAGERGGLEREREGGTEGEGKGGKEGGRKTETGGSSRTKNAKNPCHPANHTQNHELLISSTEEEPNYRHPHAWSFLAKINLFLHKSGKSHKTSSRKQAQSSSRGEKV